MATVKQAKSAKAKRPSPKKRIARVSVKDEAHIKLLVSENPRRAGTIRFKRFEAYKGNPTVAAVLAKRVTRRGIRRDVHAGLIALVR